MTRRPNRDYPLGCLYQPDEPPLQMTVAQLAAVRDGAHQAAGQPGVHAFADFLIYSGPCRRAMAWQLVRGAVWRARWKLTLSRKP